MTGALIDMFKDEFLVFFTALLPISELRGAIPLAHSLGMSPIKAFVISVIGNIIPAIFLVYYLRAWEKYLRRIPLVSPVLDWAIRRTMKRHEQIEKYGALALIMFVAIPFPTTGAWTGALAAFIFRINPRLAMPAITIGVLIAGVIVTALTTGIASFF